MLQLVRAPNVSRDDIGSTVFHGPATPPDWSQPEAAKHHGKMLLTSLMQSHDGVRKALDHALDLMPGDFCPIYLQLKALPSAEAFCWEALCKPNGSFIALDPRWQIARIAGSPQSGHRPTEAFKTPLKIMAILSAFGRDATPEWDGLYSAIKKARQAGLPIRLHVGTGQEALQDSILELSQADAEVTQFPLNSLVDLAAEANVFLPQIVHFFCHGSTSFAKPRLELATINDDDSSIELALDDLLGIRGFKESWLTVLNCCDSAAASEDVHSLTHNLVAGGVNAAIGMKETVSEVDAYEFSSRLYPAILAKLRETLTPLAIGDEAVLDWAATLWAPRKAIEERHRREGRPNAHQWTLPVLYAQLDPFRVKGAAAAEAVRRDAAAGRAATAETLTRDAEAETVTRDAEAETMIRDAADERVNRAHEQTIDEALALLPDGIREMFRAELEAVRAGRGAVRRSAA